MTDADIDYSEIPELPDDFAAQAEWFMPVPKALLSLRLDADVIEWFKSQGSGYQSRMNAVLKAYMFKTGQPDEVRDIRAEYSPHGLSGRGSSRQGSKGKRGKKS